MRVLHLTPEFPPVIWGGLGTAVGGLVTAEAHSGMTVGVLLVGGALVLDQGVGTARAYGQPIALPNGGEPQDSAVDNTEGVTFFHVAPQDAIEAGVRFAKMWKPDVLHLHTGWLWNVAGAIRKETGVPFVFTVHSLDRVEYEHGVFLWHWETQETAIAAADRVIAISQSEKALMLEYCPNVQDRVRVVGNGISDTESARDSVRMREPCRCPVVLYSGRFVDRKGIRELLHAITTVLAELPGVRFVLIGGYGGGAEIERTWLIDALLPYRSQVHFTGWLAPSGSATTLDLADIRRPSWYEPFGMVILEGMLYGLAIAAAAVGGPAEILEHERTGILFPPRDAKLLAEAVLKLAKDLPLRERISLASAQQVRRKWLWPALVKMMSSVYEELAPNRVHRTSASFNGPSTTGPRVPATAQ
jgi:glycosyltransferase involved in cell wall biosynthesis